MSNFLVINDGVDFGTKAGRLAQIMQGEVGPPIIIDVQDLAGNDFDITNATGLEGRLENAKTEAVIDITGALATSGGGISWTRAAEDIGTPGTFSAVFEFTLSGKQYKTFPASLAVIADPAANDVGGVALVGIPETDADWLTAEKAATETAAAGEILQSDGDNSEGSGYQAATSLRQHNFTATAAPGVGDDTADGYAAGSRWIDVTNDKEYVCLDASAGAAVWTETTGAAGSTDGGRMDWVIHVPGMLAQNVNARWTIPVDCRILHISAVASNNSDATIAFGISTDTDSILVPSTIGDSNVPLVFNSGDWAGTNPTGDLTAGQIAVLTVDFDGAGGTGASDLTVIVTTTGNAVGDLADISDLAAAGFSADDFIQWNGTVFANVTPAQVLAGIGAQAFDAETAKLDVAQSWSAAQNLQDNELIRPKLRDYGESLNALGALGGGTIDIDLALGNVVSGTVDTSTTTFTFSNPSAAGTACSFTLFLTNGGSQTVNWPASVDWAGGAAPALTAAGVDVLTFVTLDGGITWYGFPAGLDMS